MLTNQNIAEIPLSQIYILLYKTLQLLTDIRINVNFINGGFIVESVCRCFVRDVTAGDGYIVGGGRVGGGPGRGEPGQPGHLLRERRFLD